MRNSKIWAISALAQAFAVVVIVTGCIPKQRALNEPPIPLIVPGMTDPTGIPISNDLAAVAPVVGISGTILLRGSMPSPVNGAQVKLFFRSTGAKENLIAESTTGPDGKFVFSRKLDAGHYMIRVSGRFKGETDLGLIKKPLHDVVVDVEKAQLPK